MYDLTVGRYYMDGEVNLGKVITVHLDEPIDPEEKYSIVLKGKDKSTLLIRLFDPKEFLKGDNT